MSCKCSGSLLFFRRQAVRDDLELGQTFSSDNFTLLYGSSTASIAIEDFDSKMAEEEEIYDEIEIEDMTFDAKLQIYHFPCPCGDRFEIFIDDLRDGQDIAVCPSCSLQIRVIFDVSDLPEDKKEDVPQSQAIAT